ncbi:NAD(P)H-binding protein [Chryseobacterium suipulveris]|uniref:NAD(P)H-binding protein n=1 Tax=Chryseobacterium suipulveris TaxID=2929800 RepID=A0ABY4BM93_9FLAO|nr:NAD(P)H-binding protein [Chryseobacterium suipulveris]UOE40295.1 NAD(P)H-binding protein [Chryseobacterium suipulveris]
MKIALIGATGYVGSAILNELANRNYEVTAIARNTDKINNENENITKRNADIFNTEELTEILNGSDVVVSAYNPGWANPNIHNDYMKGAESIQKAVEKSDANRLIVIGGAGTMKIDGNYIVDGPDFPKEIYPGASAVKKYFVENLSKNETLDWEFFSPAIEMNMFSEDKDRGRTGAYRYGNDTPVFDNEGRSRHSVEDLAVAIVDEIEKKQFVRKQFTAAY